MDKPTQDPIITDAQMGLWQLATLMTKKHGLATGVAAIVIFEVLAELLRNKAPMEFDEYFDVLRQELPKGALADGDRLNTFREALQETLVLTSHA